MLDVLVYRGVVDGGGQRLIGHLIGTDFTYQIASLTPDPAASISQAGAGFVFRDQTDDRLYFSDGSSGGTHAILTDANGNAIDEPKAFTPFNGETIFLADTASVPGSEIANRDALFVTDGGGTPRLLVDFTVTDYVAVGDFIYARSSATALHRVSADGSSVPVTVPDTHFNYTNFFEFQGDLYFLGNGTTSSDTHFYRVDGGATNAVRLDGIYENTSTPIIHGIGVTSEAFYFWRGHDPDVGIELYVSDGTEAGTRLVKDINPGDGNSLPLQPSGEFATNAALGNKLVFLAGSGGDEGAEVWVTDGTEANTFALTGAAAGGSVGNLTFRLFTPMVVEDLGLVFFQGRTAEDNPALFATDGTIGGTRLVQEFDNNPAHFHTDGNRLYFRLGVPVNSSHDSVWVSNGTEAGTGIVSDPSPGENSLNQPPSLLSVVELDLANIPTTRTGDDGDNVLTGFFADETLFGLGGNDIIDGREGDDILHGGAGDDELLGRAGNDRLLGEAGADLLFGGDGNDRLEGGDDNDRLIGQAGVDLLIGGTGDDRLEGGLHDDRLVGGDGLDLLLGGDGNDRLEGGGDADRLLGQVGADVLLGGAGDDLLEGGRHNDRLFGEAGADVLAGGDGNDILDGGAENDRLFGEAGEDLLIGGAGNDRLEGGLHNDRLLGQTGADVLLGGAGNDRLEGDDGADRLFGEAGADALFGGADADRLFGQAGADVLAGGLGNDFLDGGGDADRLFGQAGADVLAGRNGDDFLDGGLNNDRLFGEAGADVLVGGGGDDLLDGGLDNDRLFGQAGADVLAGGDGNDRLDGGEGNDRLLGLAGSDVLLGGNGDDRLEGGDGNDRLFGEAGDDVLVGGDGRDVAFFADAFAEYSFAAAAGGGVAVTHNLGTDGSDLLFQMELASFADQTVGVDTLLV
ncbi:MAG TPA: hypothetical protein VHG92_00965 [Afifellaceae bacterium]|nr:hypothetical protein [Afifellaceae bacterium]